MKSLIVQHPMGALLSAVLLGMVLKWLLDLFFLRSEMFGLRRRLTDRERELTDLRHEHGRSLQELKNRLTELDATAKAKLLATSSLAARETELAGLREREKELVRQLSSAEEKSGSLGTEAASALAARDEAVGRARVLEVSLAEQVTMRGADAVELATLRSVRDALEEAVRSRDGQVSGLQEALDGVRALLETEQAGTVRLTAQVGLLEGQLEEVRARLGQTEGVRRSTEEQLRVVQAQFEAASRARSVAEASLKRREMELGEMEQRAGAMQRAVDESARESARLTAENTRLNGEVQRLAASAAAQRGADPERARLAEEVKALRSDLEAQLRLRAGMEAVAKAQEAAVAELRLQVSAAASQRRALEAELETVSRSHAELERRAAEGGAGGADGDAALVADLEAMTRERNDLAAELAVLRKGRDGGGS